MVTPRTNNFTRTARIFKSRSNRRLIAEIASHLSQEPERILLVPSVVAGEQLAHSFPAGVLGLHRISLIQWAVLLSRQYLAEESLTPVGVLGVEAIAARALHEANLAGDLQYFAPVAMLPGFAKALSRTIQELRLAGVHAEDLANTGPAGADLSKLLARFKDELSGTNLADLASILELARDAVENGDGETRLGQPFVGLPMIVLDVPLETAAHRAFFRAVAKIAPDCGGGGARRTPRAGDSPATRSTK